MVSGPSRKSHRRHTSFKIVGARFLSSSLAGTPPRRRESWEAFPRWKAALLPRCSAVSLRDTAVLFHTRPQVRGRREASLHTKDHRRRARPLCRRHTEHIRQTWHVPRTALDRGVSPEEIQWFPFVWPRPS